MSRQINVRIKNPEIWFKFKEFVFKKYATLHTVLGQEVANALELYLKMQEAHTHAQQNGTKQNNGLHVKNNSKIINELPMIKEAILQKVQPGGSIPKQILANIIRQVSNVVDRRAVGDRIEALLSDGFLKIDWELSIKGNIFRVMGDGAETNNLIRVQQ